MLDIQSRAACFAKLALAYAPSASIPAVSLAYVLYSSKLVPLPTDDLETIFSCNFSPKA